MSTPTCFVVWFALVTVIGTVYGVDRFDVGVSTLGSVQGRGLSSMSDGISSSYLPLVNAGNDPASGGFKPIGGVSMEKPCCVSRGPRRVDCFIRSKTSNILHWWKQDGKYHSEWQNLGWTVINNIECVSRSTGVIDVFVVGQNLALYVNTYTGSSGKWSGWRSKGGRVMEAPSCTARTSSVIDCMMRDGSNAALYIGSTNGKWTKMVNKGSALTWPSKTSHRSDTITDFWHIGSYSNLWHCYVSSGRWGPWNNLKGTVKGQPEVVSLNSRRIDVMVMGTKNQLMHLVWNGSWQKWVNLGGSIVDTPSCVAVGKTIHCFMTGVDSYLYRRSYDGRKWSAWFCSYGSFIESPSCVLSNSKEVSCYMRGFDRSLVEMVYNF